MTAARELIAAVVVMLSPAACTVAVDRPVATSEPSTPSVRTTAPSPMPTAPTSRAEPIRDWEARAGEHFRQSAAALEKVAAASSTEDEVGLRDGCQQLHDANSVGLQDDLPTPDQNLTNELQRMIVDMNVATHACLRFALARRPVDADTYQEYLGRAVEHLHRAKAILNALEK